ncbi:hypothetical protein [Massilia sp. Mn16-1_5]|uniref:phosphoribosyltransferase-like protein n=1 Tax=Massilia sp. Mn16-1_5 TaxID=2079199 RepID=UPI00109EA9B1|nr:hypothetical protein [Massilia sp. Mn16-1_5]
MAEHMLLRMRYIGFEEFEEWLHTSVNSVLEEIAAKNGKSAVAIFPVNKPFIHKFNKDKEIKLPSDSSGRIAHSLKNIERDLPKHVELTPRLDSMRKRKVRNIIFVDDFVGTGDRFINSWESSVSSTIKSWCSFGWCKIWFLTFAAHQSGIKKILKNIHSLEMSRIRVNLSINKSFMLKNSGMESVLRKYGSVIGPENQVMGYGGLATPIVFQYGAPNNLPLIFWQGSAGNSRKRWRPLFPNRSISSEVYPLFNEDLAKIAMPEELWTSGHYQLALNFMDAVSGYGQEQHQLLLILTLLSKKRTIEEIKDLLVLPGNNFDALLRQLKISGVIDENATLTRFAHDIIARLGRKREKRVTIREEKFYFPSSFSGFRREA